MCLGPVRAGQWMVRRVASVSDVRSADIGKQDVVGDRRPATQASMGRQALYHSMKRASPARKSRRRMGTSRTRVYSSFSVRMKRSTTAMLPYLPTAPKRGLTFLALHQPLNPSHQNWQPLSVTMYLGWG